MTLSSPVLKTFGTLTHCKTGYVCLRNGQLGKNVVHGTSGGIWCSVKWPGVLLTKSILF